ncbi:MAG: monovalent cation/H(+) antiporter subunit G [Chloroflexota bacterium]
MLREAVIMLLMLAGAFLMFLAGVGLLRMPDLFLRMSATAKAGTLGAGLIVLGGAIFFSDFGIYTRSLAIVIFLMLTAPVAAHLIGRAGYFSGISLWAGTVRDDLRGHYRADTHTLEVESVPPEKGIAGQQDDEAESNTGSPP